MSETRHADWLSMLPQVGTDIKVLLQTGEKRAILFGIIRRDDTMIYIDTVAKSTRRDRFPTVIDTASFNINEIVRISFTDNEQHFTFFGNPRQWLKDLPKSRENSVTLLCAAMDRTLDIEKGWVEYDEKKIYVREIVGTTKRGYELEDHERLISEVSAILINHHMTEPMIFLRVAEKD